MNFWPHWLLHPVRKSRFLKNDGSKLLHTQEVRILSRGKRFFVVAQEAWATIWYFSFGNIMIVSSAWTRIQCLIFSQIFFCSALQEEWGYFSAHTNICCFMLSVDSPASLLWNHHHHGKNPLLSFCLVYCFTTMIVEFLFLSKDLFFKSWISVCLQK